MIAAKGNVIKQCFSGRVARYKDISRIGSGGFGEVWKAVRLEDQKEFAKKILKITPDIHPADIERFKREVRLLKSLNHPHIIKVIAVRLNSEPFWFVMPLYNGNLLDLLPDICGKRKEINRIYGQILDAIDYAHTNGVIHRDIKPENLLYDSNRNIVISDFGLGRQLDSESTRRTYTGEMLGTLFYMAPEQLVDAKNTDERSDIYALGRVLYELFTGDHPSGQQDLSRLEGDIRHIVGKCTKSEPDERYQSVSELLSDYEMVTGGIVSRRIRDDVSSILAKLIKSARPSGEEIQEFHQALYPLRDNSDLLHDVLMSVPPDALEIYFEIYPDVVRDLISLFANNILISSWGFNYCDKIAKKIRTIFHTLHDPQIRVDMLVALLVLGVSHNRWYVWEVFANLLSSLKDPEEILAVADALTGMTDNLEVLSVTLKGVSLAEPIRRLISGL